MSDPDPGGLRFADLVRASGDVAATSRRTEKVARLADVLRAAGPGEVETVVAWLSGELPQGRLGVGPATVRAAARPPATDSRWTVRELDARLEDIAALVGAGSQAARTDALGTVLAAATHAEQAFLFGLLGGEIRQGAQAGLMADAVARAFHVPSRVVRRAAMLSGDLPGVARDARDGGRAALDAYRIRWFRPVQPMLASSAESAAEALDRLGRASFEWKLDGARVQVHREGGHTRVYSRLLNDVTAAVPEVVEAARALSRDAVVLDGEVIALTADGRPHPFQTTMRRFGRKLDVEAERASLPLSVFFFDVLALDGETWIDRPYAERVRALDAAVPERWRVPRIVSEDAEAASTFLAETRARGHEGIMAKDLGSTYEAGRRGKGWLKIKPAHTLDLVVLAAEWGHGRRTGWLSNLHLGARDPEAGGFVMLGKTFKGMTDDVLAWQTEALQSIATERKGHVVWVRPELVVEIAFNEVQASPRYPAGLALRFARLKGYRPDKRAEDADTIETVRAIHAESLGDVAPG